MAYKAERVLLRVSGMSCATCERKIETAVGKLDGVRSVKASAAISEVDVTFEPGSTNLDAISAAISAAGYEVSKAVKPAFAGLRTSPVYRFLGLIAVVGALFLMLRYATGLNFLPQVGDSMGYGLLIVIGLLTSFHCVAMCGGIAISNGLARKQSDDIGVPGERQKLTGRELGARIRPSLLYNAGRVVSYTIIGGVVGALGSLFSLTTTLKGVMPIVAGAFMLFLGIRMLGIIPSLSRLRVRIPRIPGLQRGRFSASLSRKGPFFVGLANGFMPCGPLQTMQVYALGTGSFLAGSLSMLFFSLGTVPLMLGFGALSSLLSARFNSRMVKASGVLVMALGLVMASRGLNLFGISLAPSRSGNVAVAEITGSVQTVTTAMQSGEYEPFVVQKGIPVRWIVTAKEEDLNGCNNPLTIPRFGITKRLVPGQNLIEFTPEAEGDITYTCWMGMISSTIRVVADIAKIDSRDLELARINPPAASDIGSAFSQYGSGTAPAPSTGATGAGPVPARLEDGGQVIDIHVSNAGYDPSIVVLQRGVKAKLRFIPQELNSCTYLVAFPEYNGALDLRTENRATPYLDVSVDFTFRCGMGMLNGFVKVVDDLGNFDAQAIQKEAQAYLSSVAGSGCCSP